MRALDRLTFGWITRIFFQGFSGKNELDAHLRTQLGLLERYDNDRLLRDILWRHRWSFLLSAILKLASEVITVYSVDVMRQAASALKTDHEHLPFLLSLLLSLQIFNTFCMNHQEFIMAKIGLRCSRSLLSRLFSSSLRHSSPSALHEGRLVNMMTVDVQRVENMFGNLNYVWSAPVQCLLIFWQLYRLLGWPVLIGFLVMFLYIPAQYVSTQALKKARQVVMVCSDRRIKRLENILACIKVVKAMRLESVFRLQLQALRSIELEGLRRFHAVRGAAQALTFLFTVTGSAGTLLYLVFSGHPVSAAMLVAVISYFKLLRLQVNMIPLTINGLADGMLSMRRLHSFLQLEVASEEVALVEESDDSFTVYWDGNSISAPKGSLVAIEGPSGCGKSALLCSVARQLSKRHWVSVCGQTAWLQDISIKDNILFGQQLDTKRFNEAIRLSCLESELASFPYGAETLLLQNGSNLSGGQRQRVCLARLLYSQASVWVIDDIMASLDSDTAQRIRETIARKPASVTVFFVGVIEADRVISRCPVRDLKKTLFRISEPAEVEMSPVHKATGDKPNADHQLAAYEGLAVSEQSRQGGLSWPVLRSWLLLNGGLVFAIACVVLLALINQCRIGNEVLVARKWSTRPSSFDLALFTLYSAGQVLCPLLLTVLFFHCGLGFSDRVHARTIDRVLSAPYTKHLSVQPSLILNRLGKDQESLDNGLIISSAAFAVMLGVLYFTCQAMVLMNWYMLGPISMLLLGYCGLSSKYRASMREAKRAEASSRTPICRRALELVAPDGLLTIRGLHQQSNFLGDVSVLVDRHSSLRLVLATGQAWFTLRIEILGALLTFSLGWFAAWSRMSPALAGLVLTYSSSLSGLTMWTIRQLSHTEVNLIAFERISDMALESLPEDDTVKEVTVPGREDIFSIEMVDVGASFGQLPFLKRLSCRFEAGRKTCIVGRTGSGKSSLLLTLLKLYDIESGQILINGHDSAPMSCAEVRRLMAYVPQETMLFYDQTLRINVDPNGQVPDSAIWPVLHHLRLPIDSLDAVVTPRMSISVKELVCLARGLLCNSPILLMDEPMASLDSPTLASILADPAFASLLADKTVIIVTHRSELIDYCDSVMHLGSGQLAQ